MIRDERQGDAFGRVAGAYARTRPAYPRAAFRGLVESLASEGPRALDVAAGTGVATGGLLQAGIPVVAVEPDLAMLARAADGHGPGAGLLGSVAGRAEALPIGDRTIDLVVAAQAFHWFDPDRALDEFARVLVSGGVLGLVWNVVVPDAFVFEVRAWIHRRVDDVEIPVTESMREPPEPLREHGAFELEPSRELFHERAMDADRYVAYASSWSYCGGAVAPEERASVESELRDLIGRHHGDGPWTERFVTVVHVARRVG